MLSGNDKVLLVKLFYINEKSALRKFRLQKNVKTEKRPLILAGLINLDQRFEETRSFEDRIKSRKPSLSHSPRVAAEMETLASESAAGASSTREAGRRLSLPLSSIRNILQ
ncbi:hypothetical protein NPIL_78351 [Nephila pilipes]|uniref:Uncharacterized protein n=1 Tax=Nephila pilipes TaxID=299642 RepID=A0A8X6UC70_NEPPI|nr:hypothetical protein NPIL_78351 [Nephila pilipes]